eukprot:XP_001702095.1 predicted protein [Chlamydomonas reinhardtii]
MRAQRSLPIPLPPPEVCRLPLAASILELGLHGVWGPGLIAARSSGSRQPSSPPAAAQPVTAGHGQPRQPQLLPRLLGTVTATHRRNPGRSRLARPCLPLPSRADSSAQQRQSPAFLPTSGRATGPGLIAARSSGTRQPSSPPAAAQPIPG